MPSGKHSKEPRCDMPANRKPRFTVGIDWRRARQVWGIGAAAEGHLLVPFRGREGITAGADTEVNQDR